MSEIEGKISSITGSATAFALIAVENKKSHHQLQDALGNFDDDFVIFRNTCMDICLCYHVNT